MKSLLIIAFGLFNALLINLTFFFRDEQLTFGITAIVFFIYGLFFSFNYIKSIFFILSFLLYFTIVTLFTEINTYVFFLVSIATLLYGSGIVVRYIFLNKSKALGSILLAVIVLPLVIGIYFIPDYLLNRQLREPAYKEIPDDIQLITSTRDTLTKRDLLNKILIIETWDTHCGVCHMEFDDINELKKYYSDREDLLVIALNNGISDSLERFMKFTQKYNDYDFIYAYDNKRSFEKYLQVRISPQTYLVNKKGEFVMHIKGYSKTSFRAFSKHMKKTIEAI